MSKKRNDNRGVAGSEALEQYRDNIIMNTKKAIRKVCKHHIDNKIPIIKKQIAEEVGISYATINRSPYKEIIGSYMEDEKVVLSPKGRQEVSELIKENIKLKNEIREWEEKYFRLKKELVYTKELY